MTSPADRPITPSNWHWRDQPVAGDSVIFDLDGVLSDAAGRQHLLAHPRRDWRAFFEAVGDDPVIEEVGTLLHALDRRYAVVLLTARPLHVQRHTLDWLARNELRWDLLVMRDTGDYDAAYEFKGRTVGELRQVGITPVLAFEDDHRNVDELRRLGVPCVYIHSGYYD